MLRSPHLVSLVCGLFPVCIAVIGCSKPSKPDHSFWTQWGRIGRAGHIRIHGRGRRTISRYRARALGISVKPLDGGGTARQ
jgi:hypothetical protein